MIVKRIDRAVLNAIRCEHRVSLAQLTPRLQKWRADRYGPDGYDCCTRYATWSVDGRAYCSLHGGPKALAHLAGE